MKKKLDKTTKEFAMMNEFWKIWQEFFIPEDNDEYWESLIKKTDEFVKKYNTESAKHLMIAVLTDIENRHKASK